MTDEEVAKIMKLRCAGWGYKRIAAQLGLSQSTVKMFCYRHPLDEKKIQSTEKTCPQCGAAIVQKPHTKEKRFCSDACRLLWWNSHQGEVKKKTFTSHVCEYCGRSFESYGQKPRRYCSRACYAKARTKEARPE